jgi:hypothetical protein
MARETQRLGDQSQISIQNKANFCSAGYEMATAEQRANKAYTFASGEINIL